MVLTTWLTQFGVIVSVQGYNSYGESTAKTSVVSMINTFLMALITKSQGSNILTNIILLFKGV